MFKVMLGSTESEVSLGYRGLCLKRKRKKKRKHVKKKKKSDPVTEGQKSCKSQGSERTRANQGLWAHQDHCIRDLTSGRLPIGDPQKINPVNILEGSGKGFMGLPPT